MPQPYARGTLVRADGDSDGTCSSEHMMLDRQLARLS